MKQGLRGAACRPRAERDDLRPGRAVEARGRLDRRVSVERKPPMPWPAKLVAELTRDAVARAASRGTTRGHIAASIGVAFRTLENALKPSEPRAIGFAPFCELLSPDGPLDEADRRAVFSRFAAEFGFGVVDQGGDRVAPSIGALLVTVEAGELAQAAVEACGASSPGGVDVTPDEAAAIAERAADVIAAAVPLSVPVS